MMLSIPISTNKAAAIRTIRAPFGNKEYTFIILLFLVDGNHVFSILILLDLRQAILGGMAMTSVKSVLGAVVALVPVPGIAQETFDATHQNGPEFAIGLLAHGIRRPFTSAPPPSYNIYEGEEERGTADVQILYRSAPLFKVLKPRLTARLQVNTAGRTSFASIGAEWRQHILHDRFYGQIGIGLTIHDGYRYTPDPFAADISAAAVARRYDIYSRRTAFGSRVLFNPNLSLGVRLNDRWAIEAALEHFSHKQLFSKQNPGIDTVGIRLVHVLGKK
jgi:lipid A 3-O-deacylase